MINDAIYDGFGRIQGADIDNVRDVAGALGLK